VVVPKRTSSSTATSSGASVTHIADVVVPPATSTDAGTSTTIALEYEE
jgi:hypothetical protein